MSAGTDEHRGRGGDEPATPPPTFPNGDEAATGRSEQSARWERLDARVIWVDLVRVLLSLVPMVVTPVVFGGVVDGSVLWPVAVVGAVGVVGAVADVLRWLKTRYRITGERVEVRSGLLVRSHRSVRRDRIRSVDTTARLRHRLAGLRVVAVRAGDRTGGSASLRLDAVSAATAARLQDELPTGAGTATGTTAEPTGAEAGGAAKPEPAGAGTATGTTSGAGGAEAGLRAKPEPTGVGTTTRTVPGAGGDGVLATFRWAWVPYNAFTVWAFLTAAGLGWGAYWFGSTVGVDLAGVVAGLADWGALGTGWTVVVAVLAAGVVGVIGVGTAFVVEHWGFRLVRADGPRGTVLRTSHGLFRTRRVDRDDARLRGVELREPLPWRWSTATETSVVSTGLTANSWTTGASTILPKAPMADARRVAGAVLRDDRPLATPLRAHPPAALRRRLGWAVLVSGLLTGGLWWFAPGSWWLAGVGVVPVALGLAVLAYRSLGHALVGQHLVTSHGLNRTTVVLRRGAVIGVAFRQSVLQRRLGLVTLRTTTAAGAGVYPAPDLLVADGVALADATVPGLLTPYRGEMPVSSSTVGSAA
ncbi:PH domain-containing protein [Actinophytocola gossypii]|uniref:PH domain-containing protein n=1 Tax=Actinophytocola gossypii TaxID=2812003 RepID=A0ABT2JF20_9PSEU|nr:PH domain-containing protein [Actinophytocola gossypii]MCT2586470.1 PH domain-containing protein [Actinophytocola gossypii]